MGQAQLAGLLARQLVVPGQAEVDGLAWRCRSTFGWRPSAARRPGRLARGRGCQGRAGAGGTADGAARRHLSARAAWRWRGCRQRHQRRNRPRRVRSAAAAADLPRSLPAVTIGPHLYRQPGAGPARARAGGDFRARRQCRHGHARQRRRLHRPCVAPTRPRRTWTWRRHLISPPAMCALRSPAARPAVCSPASPAAPRPARYGCRSPATAHRRLARPAGGRGRAPGQARARRGPGLPTSGISRSTVRSRPSPTPCRRRWRRSSVPMPI